MFEIKSILNNLNEKIEKLEEILLNNDLGIHEHCMELKRKVQLNRDTKIMVLNEKLSNTQDELINRVSLIEDSAQQLFDQIEIYEKECLNALRANKSTKINEFLHDVNKQRELLTIFSKLYNKTSEIGILMLEGFEKGLNLQEMKIKKLLLKDYWLKYVINNDFNSYSIGYLVKEYFIDLESEIIQDLDPEFKIDRDFNVNAMFINHEMKIERIFYTKDLKLFVKYKKDEEYVNKEICECKSLELVKKFRDYFVLTIFTFENQSIHLTVDNDFEVIAKHDGLFRIVYCDDKYIYGWFRKINCFDQYFNEVKNSDCVPFQSEDPEKPFYLNKQLNLVDIEKSINIYVILSEKTAIVVDDTTGLVKNKIEYETCLQPRIVSNNIQCKYQEENLLKFVYFDLDGRITKEVISIKSKFFSYWSQNNDNYFVVRNKETNKFHFVKYK